MRFFFRFTAALVILACMHSTAHAKISDAVWNALLDAYPPAVWNDGLATAYVDPDPSKFRGYVVVDVGGIAAERAKYFITWAEYDYRGVTIDIAKEAIKNRRGEIYAYLQRGDVMAVARMDRLGNTVYVYLISPDIYRPVARAADKHFSRVTTALKFNLPKDVAGNADAGAALAAISAWLKPFSSLDAARSYAQSVGGSAAATASSDTNAGTTGPAAAKSLPAKPVNTSPGMPPALPFTDPNDAR